jgi:Na+-translocating ferredoxin:NAD+ oxidoreductase RnfC subunit
MAKKIAEMVRQAGVVGAGGAGFPTHVKLNAKVDLVLGNGASCEPLLETDPYLMETYPDQVLQGLALVMQAVEAKRGLMCLKRKHVHALAALRKAAAELPPSLGIEVYELDDFYPAGDEHVMVHEVTGRTVPEGGIPLQVGVVVSNTESLLNIARAVEGLPVTDRYLTVCGEVNNPILAKVPLGVTLADVIDLAGGAKLDEYDIVVGGPMMGRVAKDHAEAITKVTSGVIVLPTRHYVTRAKKADVDRIKKMARLACCQCNLCSDLCPRSLMGHTLKPHLIMRAVSSDALGPRAPDVLRDALLCSECGICEMFSCPMMISPREVNAALKRELAAAGVRREAAVGDLHSSSFTKVRRIPSSRLVQRLQIAKYATHPAFVEQELRPTRVRLPLKQHLGAPARPVVRVGDKVSRGDLVGEVPADALGARIHASISGRVEHVSDHVVIAQ